jgi:NADH:ubiquinone oxidoreductase subunit K
MHSLRAFLHVALAVVEIAVFVGLVVYLKYRSLRTYSDSKVEKADIETLFGGKK